MVNVIGIDRIVFTTDYPFGNMKAARQFFDQMPVTQPEKEKIAHLNAERLFMNYGPEVLRGWSRLLMAPLVRVNPGSRRAGGQKQGALARSFFLIIETL